MSSCIDRIDSEENIHIEPWLEVLIWHVMQMCRGVCRNLIETEENIGIELYV